jgi:MarR family transcriptional regulator, 2-MHQ and catechol-resistance regulon repressor
LKSRLTDDTSAPHTLYVVHRALHAISRYAEADLQRCGLSTTDFRVMEALLHKGPLPVNVLGPKVNLTPGAISVAIDRLQERGFVYREEGERDRRIRTVALSKEGHRVIVPVYERHTAVLERLLEPLAPAERKSLADTMREIGKRAETLDEMPDDR